MTKVWILYEDPFDEGAVIHGVFSTEKRVNTAYEIFSKVSKRELYFGSWELDELEKHFPAALEGYQWYSGWKSRWAWADGSIHYGEWDLSPNSVGDLFEDKSNGILVQDSSVFASVKARSVEEAKEIAEKILSEKGEGYAEYLRTVK